MYALLSFGSVSEVSRHDLAILITNDVGHSLVLAVLQMTHGSSSEELMVKNLVLWNMQR